ncbi:hypothetical protein A0J57_04250 [Sphingobium sp. 22B]|uniref:hypothetical protein n=1 Tax=unclassified Sphingobium TaxID=2611147 RepID=UPI0007834BAD|nr:MULTISPECIES: hypothetical protein [unclassified Sphingobium]KXU33853.1 hypothetical protein AXW74_00800 [Sphingobium sp. AM]KYC33798.1 hypothetical protein A0J57_04250 [Sphingobium sp. 22B]OAP33532.1 hypothetical protein A8O16_03470 [Sphingobium sp. 20006FA]
MLHRFDRRSLLLLPGGAAISACAGEGAGAADKLSVGDRREGSRVVLQGANRLQKLALDILRGTQQRADRFPVKIDETPIAPQQATADRYFRAGVLDRRLDVRPLFDAGFS